MAGLDLSDFLWIGMITCFRKIGGICPVSKLRLQSNKRAGASWDLHSLRSMAGILSGPAAEYVGIQSIVFMMSSMVKEKSSSIGEEEFSSAGGG